MKRNGTLWIYENPLRPGGPVIGNNNPLPNNPNPGGNPVNNPNGGAAANNPNAPNNANAAPGLASAQELILPVPREKHVLQPNGIYRVRIQSTGVSRAGGGLSAVPRRGNGGGVPALQIEPKRIGNNNSIVTIVRTVLR